MKTHQETAAIREQLCRDAAATLRLDQWKQVGAEECKRIGTWSGGTLEARVILGGNNRWTPFLLISASFDWRVASKAMGRTIFSKLLEQQSTPQEAMRALDNCIQSFCTSPTHR